MFIQCEGHSAFSKYSSKRNFLIAINFLLRLHQVDQVLQKKKIKTFLLQRQRVTQILGQNELLTLYLHMLETSPSFQIQMRVSEEWPYKRATPVKGILLEPRFVVHSFNSIYLAYTSTADKS